MKSSRVEEVPRFKPLEGVEMALIGDGDNMTLIKIFIQPGAVFPDHTHLNEQIGTCVKGEGILTSGGDVLNVESGVAWTIPANEVHGFMAKGDGPVIIYEVWSPPREDYRSMVKTS
jgi:quercetin dioxygenase-like cupin family protein